MRKHLGVFVLCLAASVGCGDDDGPAPEERDSGRQGDAGGLKDSAVNNIDAAQRDAAATPDATIERDAGADAQVVTLDGGNDASLPTAPAKSYVYVGGWDWSGNTYPFRGFSLNAETGAFTSLGDSLDLGANPSNISHNAAGDRLYVTNEYDGEKGGLTAVSVDLTSGAATKLNGKPGAGSFVFTTVHPNGKFLFAADYGNGQVAVFRIDNDGKLGEETDRVQFPAAGNDPAQTHGVGIHANGNWIYVPNKALNKIAQFSFDAQTGELDRRDDVDSEGGPRHIAIAGNFAYVIHENSSMLRSFAIGQDGDLTEIDGASALPANFNGANTGAHVLVHPSGRYVYTSNRGHDSVALFDVSNTGELSLRANTPSGGDAPWDFVLDAEGKLLVLVNNGDQDGATGSLNLFKIAADGALSAFGTPVGNLKVPTGVTLVSGK